MLGQLLSAWVKFTGVAHVASANVRPARASSLPSASASSSFGVPSYEMITLALIDPATQYRARIGRMDRDRVANRKPRRVMSSGAADGRPRSQTPVDQQPLPSSPTGSTRRRAIASHYPTLGKQRRALRAVRLRWRQPAQELLDPVLGGWLDEESGEAPTPRRSSTWGMSQEAMNAMRPIGTAMMKTVWMDSA